jgi:membrane-bound metal-dependent hydrolase YbcI (DUF457 family)
VGGVSARAREVLGSILMLAFVAILWVQRDYTTPMGGIFPDRVMGITVALALVSLVLALTPRATQPEAERPAPSGGGRRWRDLFVVIGILLAWTILLRPLGFSLVSVLGFSGLTYFLSGRYRDPRSIATSLAVGVAVTALFQFVFGYLLKVPLPPGTLLD